MSFMPQMPEGVTSATVRAPLMPVTISVTPRMACASAPPTWLMNGCTAKVTALLRAPSFHWPYSTQSVMKPIIRITMKLSATNSISPHRHSATMFIGEKKNPT